MKAELHVFDSIMRLSSLTSFPNLLG